MCISSVEQIKNGDTAVFSEVFYQYSPKLYTFLFNKVQSEYVANEITQLTFIKLWKYREHLNTEIKLSTQIFQIAKTTLIDHLRKENYDRSNLNRYCMNENLFKPAIQNGYEKISEKDIRSMLQQAMNRLPPMRKKVFQLSRIEHKSHREISKELSISEKTVDKHIQLALRFIRPFFNSIMVSVFVLTVFS